MTNILPKDLQLLLGEITLIVNTSLILSKTSFRDKFKSCPLCSILSGAVDGSRSNFQHIKQTARLVSSHSPAGELSYNDLFGTEIKQTTDANIYSYRREAQT